MRMSFCNWAALTGLSFSVISTAYAASSVEKIRNPQVVVMEDTLAPGESESLSIQRSCMLVYMADGKVEVGKKKGAEAVKQGQTAFKPAAAGALRNAGESPLHLARIEFLTAGKDEVWGMQGLSPNYKMLIEDRYARAYDIRIPAQTKEPQHTHHDRVVVSLSGAQLEHILPDGKVQPSTLKTGEIVWRLGGTHVGHNMGHTDLWVIAVEPK
jgi:quercetin dioxygenase-like cupin family protein